MNQKYQNEINFSLAEFWLKNLCKNTDQKEDNKLMKTLRCVLKNIESFR